MSGAVTDYAATILRCLRYFEDVGFASILVGRARAELDAAALNGALTAIFDGLLAEQRVALADRFHAALLGTFAAYDALKARHARGGASTAGLIAAVRGAESEALFADGEIEALAEAKQRRSRERLESEELARRARELRIADLTEHLRSDFLATEDTIRREGWAGLSTREIVRVSVKRSRARPRICSHSSSSLSLRQGTPVASSRA